MHSKLKFGDLLQCRKGIIDHVGVYLGNERVLNNQTSRGITITSIEQFAGGKEIRVVSTNSDNQPLLVNRLAEIYSSDTKYNLITNNCEHLANYIVNGQKFSPQIQVAVLGTLFGGILNSQTKNGHLLLWIAGGALAGLLTYNLTKKYDYPITFTST